MSAPDHDLDALFKRLHLANARRVWRDLVQRAEREAWSYGDFLTLLVTEGFPVTSVDGRRQLEEVFMSLVGAPADGPEDADV